MLEIDILGGPHLAENAGDKAQLLYSSIFGHRLLGSGSVETSMLGLTTRIVVRRGSFRPEKYLGISSANPYIPVIYCVLWTLSLADYIVIFYLHSYYSICMAKEPRIGVLVLWSILFLEILVCMSRS